MKDVGWRRKNGENNCTNAHDQIDISYLQLRGDDFYICDFSVKILSLKSYWINVIIE
jgi:hypothetical protein